MTSYAIGSEGTAALPAGFNARLRSWSCSISRATQDISGFTKTGRNRRVSNVIDITGSAGGIPQYWDGASSGTAGGFSPIPIASDAESGALDDIAHLVAADTITLTIASGVTIAFKTIFSGYAFAVAQGGDSTVSFNFEMNDADGPTVTWDESA